MAGPFGEPDGIPAGRVRRAAPLLGTAARTTGEAVIGALRRRGRPPEPEAYARRAERYAELLGRSKGALMEGGPDPVLRAVRHCRSAREPRRLSGGNGPAASKCPAHGR